MVHASLKDCGLQKGRHQAGLARQQISRTFRGAWYTECLVNICGMIKGCFWMAEGSREMKTGFSVSPLPPARPTPLTLNAVDLKDSQSQEQGPETSVLTRMVHV